MLDFQSRNRLRCVNGMALCIGSYSFMTHRHTAAARQERSRAAAEGVRPNGATTIDYVFVDAGVTDQQIVGLELREDGVLSDHKPLCLSLVFDTTAFRQPLQPLKVRAPPKAGTIPRARIMEWRDHQSFLTAVNDASYGWYVDEDQHSDVNAAAIALAEQLTTAVRQFFAELDAREADADAAALGAEGGLTASAGAGTRTGAGASGKAAPATASVTPTALCGYHRSDQSRCKARRAHATRQSTCGCDRTQRPMAATPSPVAQSTASR